MAWVPECPLTLALLGFELGINPSTAPASSHMRSYIGMKLTHQLHSRTYCGYHGLSPDPGMMPSRSTSQLPFYTSAGHRVRQLRGAQHAAAGPPAEERRVGAVALPPAALLGALQPQCECWRKTLPVADVCDTDSTCAVVSPQARFRGLYIRNMHRLGAFGIHLTHATCILATDKLDVSLSAGRRRPSCRWPSGGLPPRR